jgi:AcrR family transcriptional regulator
MPLASIVLNVYTDNIMRVDFQNSGKQHGKQHGKQSGKLGYHHGDLRAALIEAGMRLLEHSNADQLSQRAVEREVSVSSAAVYRHFPDKAALLEALAVEGLERLGTAQRDATEAAGGGVAGFSASGRAYVHFALTHPALFRLTMAHTPLVDMFAVITSDTPSPLRLLRETVTALAPSGTDPQILRAIAIRAWSKVHGLAMLLLDGQLIPDDAMIDAVISDDDPWQAISPQQH